MWEKVKSLIRRHKSFVVTTHVFPDGDAIGSQLALARILRRAGKTVLAVNEHPVPEAYRFLDRPPSVKVLDQTLRKRIAACDVAFLVDAASPDRVGEVGQVLEQQRDIRIVCIDHHPSNTRFADENVIDTSAAATGELIYDLAKALRTRIPPRTASCLFAALATDTGWFRFPNTSARALRVAAELTEHGAHPDRLYEALYETIEWRRLKLMELALGTLRSACNGRIAYFCVTEQMLRDTGATHEDTDRFTEIPRVLRGVKLILLFREVGEKVRVSFRSKGGFSVERLARKHGGGGHAKAAGAVLPGPIDRAVRAVLADARRLFRPRAS